MSPKLFGGTRRSLHGIHVLLIPDLAIIHVVLDVLLLYEVLGGGTSQVEVFVCQQLLRAVAVHERLLYYCSLRTHSQQRVVVIHVSSRLLDPEGGVGSCEVLHPFRSFHDFVEVLDAYSLVEEAVSPL